MAFNWKTFQTRTLTAIVFVAVMLTGLLWNHWSFLILFSIIHFGCWWEYLKLVEKIFKTNVDKFIRYILILCGFVIMIVMGEKNITRDLFLGFFGLEVNLKWALWIICFLLVLIFLFQNKSIPAKARWLSVSGFIYLSVSCGLMLWLRNWNHFDYREEFGNKAIPVGLVASIWTNDTMAYIVGSVFGKTQLSKISPKKTWEGTIGGIILSVIIVTLIFNIWLKIFTIFDWISIALISSIVGTFGDLLESKLKRMAGVKDSGSIMPGHGGFLDRFDSLLPATPAVWLYVYFFM